MTTWQAMSRFVRSRDPKCVTCGGPNEHAGHYKHNSERSQQLGGNALWFDLRNINSQCVSCNTYKAGNLTLYAIYLEEKHGVGILQELNRLWLIPKKWTREEIEAKRQSFALE